MKVRKNAKRILKNFKRHRAFFWSVNHLAQFMQAKYYDMAKRMADAPYFGENE